MAEYLGTQNVLYEVRGDGAVYVPSDMVGELRLQVAGQGLVGSSTGGYELFDKTSAFGTTNFVQNINAKRALEGELARTIGTLPAVSGARVHVVIPKQQLFTKEQTPPSAAVALNLGQRQLTPEQINGIANLVAASVPGLSLTEVTIIDQRGITLFNGADNVGSSAIAHARSALESTMQQQLVTLLERITGPGQVAVRVSAQMNTDIVEETSEIYDPAQQVIRSEQTIESTSTNSSGTGQTPVGVAGNIPGGEGAAAAGNSSSGNEARTETTTNYEIGKTVRNLSRQGGELTRLSIAVLLGGRVTEGEDGTRTTTPFTDDERASMTRLVESAVGFNDDRGDTLELVDMPFVQTPEPAATATSPFNFTQIMQVGQQLLLVLGLIAVAVLVVRPILNVLLSSMGTPSTPGPLPALGAIPGGFGGGAGGEGGADLPGGIGGGGADPRFNVKQRESAAKKAGEVIDQNPEESLSVVRTWMAGSTPSDDNN